MLRTGMRSFRMLMHSAAGNLKDQVPDLGLTFG